MKKLQVLLMALIATPSVFAAKAKPDIVCIEKSTKWKYEFYFSRYNEIHITDREGQEMPHIDGFQVKTMVLESYPSILEYKFVQGRNVIAEISFVGNSRVGVGEMVDHDNQMTCQR